MEAPFDFTIARFHDLPGFQSSLRHLVTASCCFRRRWTPVHAEDVKDNRPPRAQRTRGSRAKGLETTYGHTGVPVFYCVAIAQPLLSTTQCDATL
jgi:hypothetical protein